MANGRIRLTPAQRKAAQQLADGAPSTSIEPAILKALDRAGVAERFVPAAGHLNFKAAYRLTSSGREAFRATQS